MDVSFMASDLKKADPDRYLLSLFAPRAMRPALWALFLFNHELVRTRAMVGDTSLGLIRLQWWRDEITRIYRGGSGGEVPILSTLAPVIHAQDLPQDWFEDLLLAREFDLEDVAPASWQGLCNYADFTTTPLNRLALKITGESAKDAEIRDVSINYGLIEAIRSVPLLLSQGRCLLPEDILREINLTPQKIIDHDCKQDVIAVLSALAENIASYRKPETAFLRKQQKLCSIYLQRLRKTGFDVFSPMALVPPPFLALRLSLT